MTELASDPIFCSIIGVYKNVDSCKHPFCIGHIQKMFNIAIKLLLCLILSAEHARSVGCNVRLGYTKAGIPICLNDGDLLAACNYPYAFDSADCPIDSIILNKIDAENRDKKKTFSGITWSQIGKRKPAECYMDAQNEIGRLQNHAYSNLYFDFDNWNG